MLALMKQLAAPQHGAPPTRALRQLDWVNIVFLAVAHVAAAVGVAWVGLHFNPWTVLLAASWLLLCSMSITAGYHRLFAHRSYEAAAWVRLVALLFGAASVQNSALRWVNEHRLHHSNIDGEGDPYSVKDGFLWAHIGWVFFKTRNPELKRVRDLRADPLVMWQHRYYVPLAIGVGALLPMAIGALWGDALGGLFVAGFLRLVCQYHATFATNSLAHGLGSRPYDRSTSARDSFITALFTFGEGYHNFHHRFENDYRNGVQPWHFDPTKWLIFALSRLGATHNLRRVTPEKIDRARLLARGHTTLALTPEVAHIAPIGLESPVHPET
jgi:stearoyl-CoA desaturase (delta-9 desaturase)